MEQVKIFYANCDPEALEQEINEWYESVGEIEVLQRSMVASGRMDHHVTITIWYRTV